MSTTPQRWHVSSTQPPARGITPSPTSSTDSTADLIAIMAAPSGDKYALIASMKFPRWLGTGKKGQSHSQFHNWKIAFSSAIRMSSLDDEVKQAFTAPINAGKPANLADDKNLIMSDIIVLCLGDGPLNALHGVSTTDGWSRWVRLCEISKDSTTQGKTKAIRDLVLIRYNKGENITTYSTRVAKAMSDCEELFGSGKDFPLASYMIPSILAISLPEQYDPATLKWINQTPTVDASDTLYTHVNEFFKQMLSHEASLKERRRLRDVSKPPKVAPDSTKTDKNTQVSITCSHFDILRCYF